MSSAPHVLAGTGSAPWSAYPLACARCGRLREPPEVACPCGALVYQPAPEDAPPVKTQAAGAAQAPFGAGAGTEGQPDRETDLLEALIDVTAQACGDDGGRLDSRGSSAYADAIRLLAREGLVEVERDGGRRVIGRWTAP